MHVLQADDVPRVTYQTPQEALALAKSLSQGLKSYQEGAGPYVRQYLKNVEGKKYKDLGPKYTAKAVHEVSGSRIFVRVCL